MEREWEESKLGKLGGLTTMNQDWNYFTLEQIDVRRQFSNPWRTWISSQGWIWAGNLSILRKTEPLSLCASIPSGHTTLFRRRNLVATSDNIFSTSIRRHFFDVGFETKIQRWKDVAIMPSKIPTSFKRCI